MRPAYAIEYDYVDPLNSSPPWRPSGSKAVPGRADQRTRAMRRRRPGLWPHQRRLPDPGPPFLPAAPRPTWRAGGHLVTKAPGALPAVHLPGGIRLLSGKTTPSPPARMGYDLGWWTRRRRSAFGKAAVDAEKSRLAAAAFSPRRSSTGSLRPGAPRHKSPTPSEPGEAPPTGFSHLTATGKNHRCA